MRINGFRLYLTAHSGSDRGLNGSTAAFWFGLMVGGKTKGDAAGGL
jgi:hypothetical protein